jgi:hypothetical protein
VENDDLIKLFNTPLINEAIFLASPDLYRSVRKWILGNVNDVKKVNSIKISLLKYIIRMSFRATPFGLFSALSIAEISHHPTRIEFDKTTNFIRHNRLNPEILSEISKNLMKQKGVIKKCKFFNNTSLYSYKNKLRYYESLQNKGSINYEINEIDNNEYLKAILNYCEKGQVKNDIVGLLILKGIPKDEAVEYVEELIKNEVLISEINLIFEGDTLSYFINFCKINNVGKEFSKDLILVQKILNNITIEVHDLRINQEKYDKIKRILKRLDIKDNYKYLVTTDTFHSKKSSSINISQIENIKNLLAQLYLISDNWKNEELLEISENIIRFSENEEINITKLFDPSFDIQTDDTTEYLNHSLLEGIDLTGNKKEGDFKTINITPFESQIIRKIKLNRSDNLNLKDIDFVIKRNRTYRLPDTFSVFTNIVRENNIIKVVFNNSGGSSAANIIGRFDYFKPFQELIESIVQKEDDLNKEKILAEFLHFPSEERLAYIVTKFESIREYKIPYLCSLQPTKENILNINDLYISVDIQTGYIKLRSKTYNKEVVPMMTHTHNTNHKTSLSIYKFFGNLRMQNRKYGLGVNLDNLLDIFGYIPRIEYKNIIIQKATWLVPKKEFLEIIGKKYEEDSIELKNEVADFRRKYSLPEFIVLVKFDNKIPINLKNTTSFLLLLSTIKNDEEIVFEEFFDSFPFDDGENEYSNEVIIHFYKNGEE